VDKSKMAKAGTKIDYDINKGEYGQEQMSRRVKQACCGHCYDDSCNCKEGLDDILAPPPVDPCDAVCCTPPSTKRRRELS
jgi:hypothetical protein